LGIGNLGASEKKRNMKSQLIEAYLDVNKIGLKNKCTNV